MKIEISYKNSVIGSLSEGESIALHLNGQKLTEDLVVRAVEDTVYTIKAGTYILHSNIISNTVTASELTNLGVYVYDGTSYVSVIGGMLHFAVDSVYIHSGAINHISCNGSAWIAHYTLDGDAILSKKISYDPSYMQITVLEDTTVTKKYYDVFTTNTDKKLSAPTITTDGTVVTITDTSGLATEFGFYSNGVPLFYTTDTVVNLSEKLLDDYGAGTYNITVTALAEGYEESEPSNAVEYVVKEKITDLTGTTWYVPSGWATKANYLQSFINYTIDGGTRVYSTFYAGYYYDSVYKAKENVISFYYSGMTTAQKKKYITPETSFTIKITGGNDVTWSYLITWLETYGELQ